MAYLKYDTEIIDKTKRTYSEKANDMKSLQKEMESAVNNLRDCWKSEAGDAFFNKYSDEWVKGITQYQEVLAHMAKNLDNASGEYSKITVEAKKLKI